MEEDTIDQRQKLSNVPLSELVKAQKELGFKKTQQILMSEKESDTYYPENYFDRRFRHPMKKAIIPTKIKSEAPLEISAKIRPKQQPQDVMKIKKTIKIDPRFGERFGKYDEDKFNKSYGFIDELRQSELSEVNKKLNKTKNIEEKEKLKHFQKSAMNRIAAIKDKSVSKDVEKIIKTKEKEISTKSNTPFYFKNSVKKQFHLAHKFSQLKRHGKLDKYLQKKRVKVGKIESRRPYDDVNQ